MEIYRRIKIDIALVCLYLIAFGFFNGDFDRDSTDGEQRSGMRLRIDHGTGCQYLESSHGDITPRMDANGKQVCTYSTK